MVPTVSALERFHCIYECEVVEIFSYEHLKRFSNGKMLNFLLQSNQGGLPKLSTIFKHTSTTPKVIVYI